MKDYSDLKERYEDALFDYLMESVRLAEGQAAIEENEKLKSDPNAAVSPELDEKCLALIRGEGSRMSRQRPFRWKALLRGAAVAVIVLVLTGVVAYGVSPLIRANVNQWVVNVFDKGTEIHHSEPGNSHLDENGRPSAMDLSIEAGWLPEGFSLDSTTELHTVKRYVYRSNNGQIIEACINYQENAGSIISTETCDTISYAEFMGQPATVLSWENGAERMIIWFLDDYAASVEISSTNISENDLLHFAEELIIG